MSNTLSAATWKRLTLAVALSAASFALPASDSDAFPTPAACKAGQRTVTLWFHDAALTQPWCQDTTIPCPGESATHHCDNQRTPYFKIYCQTCLS
jgi:hypothetical protein